MSAPSQTTSSTTPRKGSGRMALLFFACLIGFELLKTMRFHTPKQIDLQQMNLRDLRGQPLPASTFAGKAVLLNYWAPWCGPCKLEIPWLAEMQREHPNDLVILGIVDDPQDYMDAIAYMRSKGATYPLIELSRQMSDTVGAMHTVPTTFYLSRTGRVLHANDGVVPKPVMTHWVNDAIEAK